MKLNLGFASLCLLAVACSGAADGNSGTADSDIASGEIVAGNSPYYWANLSYEDHLRALAAAGAEASENLTAVDDPLRVRLQAWADRFDAALRQTTGNRVAPHPVVLVTKSSFTFNAWSSGTLARLGVPFGDPTASGSAPMEILGLFGAQPLDAQDASGLRDLLVRPAEWTRLQSFTQIWNMAKGECSLSAAGGRITPGDGCSLVGTSASDVAISTTSPFITVSTDLVATFDESAMAFVMAHELGHLYRAHASPLTSRKYSFWYEQGPKVPKRPVPSGESEELQAAYSQLVRKASPLDDVPNARYAAAARFTVVALASSGAFRDCDAFTSWASNHDVSGLVNEAHTSTVQSDRLRSDYLSLEQVVRSCPNTATFTDENQMTALPGQVSNASSLLRYYARTPEGALPRAGETVGGYLERLDQTAQALAASAKALLARVREENIGFYTTEQEADEVALELLARVGISSEMALDGWLSFMKSVQGAGGGFAGEETGDASAEQCEQWLKDGFVRRAADGSEEPVVMTLGSLEDTHHGNCYRLYNLWREAQSHRRAAVPAPEPLSPSWDELAAHARALTEEAASQGL